MGSTSRAFGGRHLVATDDVHAGVGDEVIVCLGAPARASAGGNDTPVDAAVLGVVDRLDFEAARMAAPGAGPGIRRPLTVNLSGPGGVAGAVGAAGAAGIGGEAAPMIRGKVVGQVWATRKARGLDGQKLLLVAAHDAEGEPNGRLIVAVDVLDTHGGEDVTVAFGSGARNVLRPGPENRDLLCDAAVAAIIEGAG